MLDKNKKLIIAYPRVFDMFIHGDTLYIAEDTGIIHVKEDDGSHRYFDLHGHPLPGRPDKGIYIDNGKKLIKK